MTSVPKVIWPSPMASVAYVAMTAVQALVGLGLLMLLVRRTDAVWPVISLVALATCWLLVRSCRVRVVLADDVIHVHNRMRAYRVKAAELEPELGHSRVGLTPVLIISYSTMGRWWRLMGGLPLAATGSYGRSRRERAAAAIEAWLAANT